MKKQTKISDELLAAYLDGNATSQECLQVLEALREDDVLREMVGVALEVDNEMECLRLPQMRTR